MAEDFSANPTEVENFTQSSETDQFQGYRDHSKFLPEVNKTESIERFFGSTVNQLLSSGSTISVDAYWGRLQGRSYNQTQDRFQEETSALRLNYQFTPGVVRRENDNVETAISYSDWIKRFANVGADVSNHDQLFSEPGYVLDLPINVDMFVNFTNYYWLEGNMPIIDIEATSYDPIDIDDIIGLDQYTTPTLTNGKTLTFVTGLRVRFVGSDVSSTSGDYNTDWVYYVENVGGNKGIKLLASEDDSGTDLFPIVTPYSVLYPKGWDLDPWDSRDWDERGFFEDYSILTTETREDLVLNKTYIVMERWATDFNPWARTNRWFSIYALRIFGEFNNVDIEPYLNRRTRACRPIIEWQANIELFNHCKNYAGTVDYVLDLNEIGLIEGQASASVDGGENFLEDGDTIVSVSDDFGLVGQTDEFGIGFGFGFASEFPETLFNQLLTVSGVGTSIVLTPSGTPYSAGEYVTATKGLNRGISFCWDGSEWSTMQSKTTRNAAPLFNLYTDELADISALSDTDFEGDPVFKYRQDENTPVDPELGFSPSLSTSVSAGNFNFDFTLNNNRYRRNVSLTSSSEIRGLYNWHNWVEDEYFNCWSNIRDSQRVPLIQTIVSDGETTPQFDLGTTNTEYTNLYAVSWTPAGYRWYTESYSDRVDIGENSPDLIWKRNVEYQIQDLITDDGLDIVFTDPYGNPNSEILLTISSSDNNKFRVKVTNDYPYNKVIYNVNTSDTSLVTLDGVSSINATAAEATGRFRGEIILSESNQQRYQVRKNGQILVEDVDYTVSSTVLTVNTEIEDGDVFELSYIADADLDGAAYEVAPVHYYNSLNKPFEMASFSELFGHFDRQITPMPGFEGKVAGENNYHKTRRLHSYDGLIRQQVFETSKVQYLFNDERLNPSSTLKTVANDYERFKKTFKNKVRQLWQTESWNTVRELVDRALSDINIGKNSNFAYANSDMAYYRREEVATYSISDGTTTFRLPKVQNFYGDVQNHIQVYLNDYDGSIYRERQLVNGVDYTITGVNLELTQAATLSGDPATLTIRWYGANVNSHIPFSAVKLGFFRPTQVEIVDGVLIGHDGAHHVASNTEFFDLENENFDIVTASLLDFELRVFNNLTPGHFTNFSMNELYPSPHYPMAYSISDVNSRLDDWYNRYAVRENLPNFNDGTYDIGDRFTWNLSGQQPRIGGWRGVYHYYFDTDRPHTHPWEMLGFGVKPSWWNTYYSWTAGSQRDALIDALKTGRVSEPATLVPIVIDERYARSNIDWTTDIVVTADGNDTLNDPVTAGIVSPFAEFTSEKQFEFGDWGNVEDAWRKTSEYRFALAEVFMQLKPYRTHEKWWNLGRLNKNTSPTQTQWVNTDTCLRNRYAELHNQMIDGGVIVSINVVDGGSGYVTPTLDFVENSICLTNAQAEVILDGDVIDSIRVTNPGRGYITAPRDTVLSDGAGSGAVLDYVIETDYFVKHLGFNSLPAEYFEPELTDSTDLSADLYGLTLEHIVQVGGFTDNRIIDLEIESTKDNGRFVLPSTNYDIVLNENAPIKTVYFSGVKIEKTEDSGYQVSGYDVDSQRFYYTPVSSSGSVVSESIGTATIERALHFKNEVEYVRYGHVFNRRQELYSFLLGLGNYYKTLGFEIDARWEVEAKAAISWSLGEFETPYFLNGSQSELTYRQGTQGFVKEITEQVLDKDFKLIKKSDLLVLRNDETTSFGLKSANSSIFGLRIDIVEVEHIIAIENESDFNDIIYAPELGISQSRVKLIGEKTRNWNGKLEAPGYLVRGNGILLNMESSVREVERDWINSETKALDRLTRKTLGYNVGYSQATYLKDSFIDDIASYRFEKGQRSYQGTALALNAMQRSRNIFGEEFEQKLYEDWMVLLGSFGDKSEEQPLQFQIDPDLVKGTPQHFKFSDTFLEDNPSDLTINIISDDEFAVSGNFDKPFDKHINWPLDNTSIFVAEQFQEFNRDAGLPLVSEVDYFINSIDDIETVYDANADYANIPNWNNITAYAKDDVVRLGSRVYRLDVESTGVTTVSDDVVIRGTQVFPEIANGLTFIANGETVTFSNTGEETTNNAIVVNGSEVNPTVPSGSTLTLDGVNINFINNTTTVTWLDISIDGAITEPTVENNATKTLVIGYADNEIDSLTTVTVDFNETSTTETLQEIWSDAFGGSYTGSAAGATISRVNAWEAFRTDYIAALSTAAWQTVLDNYFNTVATPTSYVNPENIGALVSANPGAAWETEARALIDNDLAIIEGITGNPATEDQSSIVSGVLNDAVQFAADLAAANAVLDADDDLKELITWMDANPSVVMTISTEITLASATPARYETDTLAAAIVKINNALTLAGATDIIAETEDNGSGDVLRIRRTNTDQGYRLVVLSGDANDDFGITDNTEGVLSSQTNIAGSPLNLTQIVDTINQAALDGVSAVESENALQLISINDSLNIQSSTATSGLGLSVGLINATTDVSVVPVDLTIFNIVDQINDAEIDDLAASQVDGALILTYSGNTLEIGAGTANTQLGLVPDSYSNIGTETVQNVFDVDEWTEISEPAEFAIWSIDNIGSNVSSVINTSNRYQVYRTVDIDLEILEICQGTENGDDALVKLYAPHYLSAGDYVLLLNTSSRPSVDGIHRVTSILDEESFFIDSYIDAKGFTGKAIPLRSTRFNDSSEIFDLESNLGYVNGTFGLANGALLYADEANFAPEKFEGLGGVYRVSRSPSDGSIQFQVLRFEEPKTKNSTIVNGILYSSKDKTTLARYEVFNPLEGIIPGVAEAEIDVRSDVDRAIYNSTTDSDADLNEKQKWGREQLGTTWWNLSTAVYLNYEQGNDDDRQTNWGQLFPTASIDVYEWTKSPVTPDQYTFAVQSGTIVDGIILSGEPYAVVDQFGEKQYYWCEEIEVNVNTNQFEVFYYFWVRNKTTVPNNDRTYTVTQLEAIIESPDSFGINWIAATSDSTLLVSNFENIQALDDAVMQVNFDKFETDCHKEYALLSEGDPKQIIPGWLHLRLRDSLAGFSQGTKTVEYENYDPGTTYTPGMIVLASDSKFYEATISTTGNDPVADVSNDYWMLTTVSEIDPAGDLFATNTVELAQSKIIPDRTLHPFERLGLQARPAQTMFNDIEAARRAAVEKINSQLIEINLIDSEILWRDEFDRSIEIDDETIDLTQYWDFVDWNQNINNPYDSGIADFYVDSVTGLDQLTAQEGQVADVLPEVGSDSISRASAYRYINNSWQLIFKQKATIQFSQLLWENNVSQFGWDVAGWDINTWDRDSKFAIAEIFDSFRNAIWTGRYESNYTDLWFHMAKHVLRTQDEVNWLIKSSYVNLSIEDSIEKKFNKIFDAKIDELFDYVNTVKPFRTKISSAIIKKTAIDDGVFVLSDAVELSVQTNLAGDTVDSDTRTFRLTQGTDGSNWSSQVTDRQKALLARDISYDDDIIIVMTADPMALNVIGSYPGAAWINNERIEYTNYRSITVNDPGDVLDGYNFVALHGVTRGEQSTLARPHYLNDLIVFESGLTLTENNLLSDWNNSLPIAWQDLGTELLDAGNTQANGVVINSNPSGIIGSTAALEVIQSNVESLSDAGLADFSQSLTTLGDLYIPNPLEFIPTGNILTSPKFDSSTGWFIDFADLSSGIFNSRAFVKTNGAGATLGQITTANAGDEYTLTFTISAEAGSGLAYVRYNNVDIAPVDTLGVGEHSIVFTPGVSNAELIFRTFSNLTDEFTISTAYLVINQPVSSVAPAFSGTLQDGETVTLSDGVWTNTPTGYTYQILLDGEIVSNTNSYTLTTDDVGKTLTGFVTAENAGGSSATGATGGGIVAP